jgi:choline dehydrogenase
VYDYVVVGAGSAGCVLAARLSQDPDVTVLLLEAGPVARGLEVRLPAAFPRLFKTRWDWDYETVAQPGLDGRTAYWPRMRAVGGCSAMNAMIYMRGHRDDYDGWRDGHGAAGWGYADVLPYFRRAEDNARGASPYHGTGGPLHVEDRRYTHPLVHDFVASAVAAGHPEREDFNGPVQLGVGLYQVTCRRGRRWSAADAYLRPARTRPNLTVLPEATVRRVLLEGSRAVGVDYSRAGRRESVRADREVLLCGGAVNSPHLLMLSGIGPADHLREIGIEPVVDLPRVGSGLQDHPAVPLVWHTPGVRSLDQAESPTNLARWLLTGRGPLASNVGEGGGFLRTAAGQGPPDVQLHVAGAAFWDNGLAPPPGPAVTIAPTLVEVRSRGRLRLRAPDPGRPPLIDPGYYTAPEDLEAMMAGCRAAAAVVAHRPLASRVGASFLPERLDPDDDVALRAHVRRQTQTLYHPVGTCAMGGDDDSVVDPELRVRRVAGLRVVDASVMPAIVRGNTHAPTVMLAERAADLVLRRATLPAEDPAALPAF